jgi:hypothetical protein
VGGGAEDSGRRPEEEVEGSWSYFSPLFGCSFPGLMVLFS